MALNFTPTSSSASAGLSATCDSPSESNDKTSPATATAETNLNHHQPPSSTAVIAKPSTPSFNMTLSHKNKIRLLYFTFRISTGVINPFMTLYMQQIGLSPSTIGTLMAIRPIVTMICAPAWGTLADMTGCRKSVLLVTFTISFICRCSTYFFATTNSNNDVIQLFAIALCVTSAFYAPVASLLDSIVVSSLTTISDKTNFGQLRLWSELGSGASSSIMINVINNNNSNNQRSASSPTIIAPPTTTTTIGVMLKKFWDIRLGGGQSNTTTATATATTTTINTADGRFDRMFLLHAISSVIALLCMMLCVPTSTITTAADMAMTTPPANTAIITAAATTSTTNGQSLTTNIETDETSQQQQHQQQHDWKEGLHVIINNAQLVQTFGLVATAGLCLAILENFCYINIKQLYTYHNALDVVGRDMSIYRLFTSAGGTLAWWYSGYLGKRLGTNVVMYTSICSLPICFYLYAGGSGSGSGSGMNTTPTSMIHWYTKLGFIIAEMIRSGIFAILWSTATVRVNRLCPSHVSSMVQTMLEVSYRGIGHTTGSYLGGVLCKAYDINTAFIIVGKGLGTLLCVVGAFGWFWSNHHHHHRYNDSKKVKTN